jgi:hypothetical protein
MSFHHQHDQCSHRMLSLVSIHLVRRELATIALGLYFFALLVAWSRLGESFAFVTL